MEKETENVRPVPKPRKSPMDMFFSMGPKDAKRKADFDYYLYWIIFLVFGCLALNYFYQAFRTGNYTLIGWGIVLSIFAYFNFSNLKGMREARKFMKEAGDIQQAMKPMKIEGKDEMLKEFK